LRGGLRGDDGNRGERLNAMDSSGIAVPVVPVQ
jgi:hypothetical protein